MSAVISSDTINVHVEHDEATKQDGEHFWGQRFGKGTFAALEVRNVHEVHGVGALKAIRVVGKREERRQTTYWGSSSKWVVLQNGTESL